ncbi:protein E6A [Equid gammaherpesvirus 2]|uniref:Protein E6A n=1 Tax=Equine herpesvirus 2 (strain 86/87) TaxID=82831 RepID=VG12_EHV2|nr:protein E6A [Equid gammaherpesvirus 2]Q66618.2 RecName: Full=Protein E6A; Flags: Precursor [Equid herpesvirus type 2 strain 86/87]AAC13801.2 protein E6A [Equid gammaherpesvirus 2]
MTDKFYFYGLFWGILLFVFLQHMQGNVPPTPLPPLSSEDLVNRSATPQLPPTCDGNATTFGGVKFPKKKTPPACACKVLEKFSCMGSFGCIGYSWGCSCCCFKSCKNVTTSPLLQ